MNFLDVYPYEKWADKELPSLKFGQVLTDYKLEKCTGQTCAPNPLTEADLITKMDQNGIGTDATIHEHIKTI